MCHPFPTTSQSVPVSYTSRCRYFSDLEALALRIFFRLERVCRFRLRLFLAAVLLDFLDLDCSFSLLPTASSVSVSSLEDESVNTVLFVSSESLMETTAVVWGTSAAVFLMLKEVRLVLLLAGSYVLRERRRFFRYLLPLLSFLWLPPPRFPSLEFSLLFLLWLDSLVSFNRNSSGRMCLFSSSHHFFHLRNRPAACCPMTFLIRSNRWPGTLGMDPLLLVFPLQWSGSLRERPLCCSSW